ncbi:hypothetical protein [Moorena sp. SIO3I8]|nr:hypothetical protein [Moorena sp. SIO3I8]
MSSKDKAIAGKAGLPSTINLQLLKAAVTPTGYGFQLFPIRRQI